MFLRAAAVELCGILGDEAIRRRGLQHLDDLDAVFHLAAMGSGHWAADAGAGYTYLNEQVGFEWSAIVGFTYNFINPYTQYRSGVDVHLDWAISPVLTKRLHIGAVGYRPAGSDCAWVTFVISPAEQTPSAAPSLEFEAGAAAGAGLNGSSMCGFRVTPISGPEE